MANITRPLFVSVENVKQKSIIDGNVDSDKLVFYILESQEIHIRQWLGDSLYNRLTQGITANNLNRAEADLIDLYISDTLIYYVASEYVLDASFTVANGGVFNRNPENANEPSRKDVIGISERYLGKAQYYAERLVKYLCNNESSFPQYSAPSDDINPKKDIDYLGGIYLGD